MANLKGNEQIIMQVPEKTLKSYLGASLDITRIRIGKNLGSLTIIAHENNIAKIHFFGAHPVLNFSIGVFFTRIFDNYIFADYFHLGRGSPAFRKKQSIHLMAKRG